MDRVNYLSYALTLFKERMFPSDYRCIYLLATLIYDMTNRWGNRYLWLLSEGHGEMTGGLSLTMACLASLRELPESGSP